MLSIAVIEDNAAYAAMLKGYILREPSFRGQVSVDLYLNPGGFLEGMEKGRQYGLCFSDIEMPGMGGLKLAEEARKRDPGVLWVFLTAYPAYALEGYQVEAFDYVLKERLEGQWPRLVERIVKRLAEGREKEYKVVTPNTVEVILLSSIVYIYKEGKYCHFVLEDGRDRPAVRKTIREIGEELERHENFLLVKRGDLINLEKIRKYTAEQVIMNNGDELIIGRMHVTRVREAVMGYMERK